MTRISLPRRSFLATGTLSAAAFGLLSGLPKLALGASPTEGDAAILNVALGLEHEAIAAYQIGAESGLLKGGLLDVAVLFQGHHKTHRDAQEEAIWTFAKELLQTQRVSEPTFNKAKQLFGQHGVVDLVGVMGYYGLVSMTLNTFQVPLPEGEAPPFKE